VAHYRLGAYAKAIETLEQSEKLNATKDGSHPADLAFLAMAHHQVGHKEQARAILARLRDVMKQKTWAKRAEAQGFLREANALIEGKPADHKKRSTRFGVGFGTGVLCLHVEQGARGWAGLRAPRTRR